MYEKAFELAAKGKSNAEIFGELELTSGSLMALLQTKPHLLFHIINGRAEYIQPLLETVHQIQQGEDLKKSVWEATMYLINRAEQQNKYLTISHEMVLTAGQPAQNDEKAEDASTVTALLRKKS